MAQQIAAKRLADFVSSGLTAGIMTGLPLWAYGLGRMKKGARDQDLVSFTGGAGFAMSGTGIIIAGPIIGGLVAQTPVRPPRWPIPVGMAGLCYGMYHYGRDGGDAVKW